MPTITLLGSCFVILGMIIIAFTPSEKVVQVTSPTWGTIIAVVNSEGTMAASASVPYAEPGKILAWDRERKIYRWVNDDQ